MKALIMQGPGESAIGSIPEPVATEDQLLLKVQMIGLCGSDLNSFRGKNPMVTYPRIPGHEVAATIVDSSKFYPALAAGTNVTMSPYTSCGKCASCRRNRPNACQFNQTLGVQQDGALTEYIVMRAEKLYPAKLKLKELCLVEPLTVGFHAVRRGRVTAQDIVAVFGCGGVGLGAIAASYFAGATTIGIDVDDRKLEIARKAGAAHTIHTQKELLHKNLMAITGGQGPDVAIEAVGMAETFRAAVDEVAFTGRVVYIGYAKEPVAYETKLFVQKELDIMGSRNALPEDFRQVIRMLEDHCFPVDETVSTIVSLEEAPQTLQAWSNNPPAFTKIMVSLQ